jgi:hypothetical protein
VSHIPGAFFDAVFTSPDCNCRFWVGHGWKHIRGTKVIRESKKHDRYAKWHFRSVTGRCNRDQRHGNLWLALSHAHHWVQFKNK